MQKKINFNLPVLTLDGKPLKDAEKEITLSDLLGPLIAQQTKGDAVKLFDWAITIFKKESIFLDKSDQNLLKDLIIINENLTVLVKAQLLNCFD